MDPRTKRKRRWAALVASLSGIAGLGTGAMRHGLNKWTLAGVAVGMLVGGLILLARKRFISSCGRCAAEEAPQPPILGE